MAVNIEIRDTSSASYNFKTIHILIDEYAGTRGKNEVPSFRAIGWISFQQTIGTDSWYARRLNTETDSPEHFKKLAKVFSKLRKYDSSVEETIQDLGNIKEYVFIPSIGEYIPKDKLDWNLVAIIDSHGSVRRYELHKALNTIVLSEGDKWKHIK
jgi:hypothetical protein